MQNNKFLAGIKSGVENLENKSNQPIGALEGLENRVKEVSLPKIDDNNNDVEVEEVEVDIVDEDTPGMLSDIFKTKANSETMKSITATIRVDQIKSIERICKKTKKNRSEFIRELLDIAINAYK